MLLLSNKLKLVGLKICNISSVLEVDSGETHATFGHSKISSCNTCCIGNLHGFFFFLKFIWKNKSEECPKVRLMLSFFWKRCSNED